jgi:hypothetical protein
MRKASTSDGWATPALHTVLLPWAVLAEFLMPLKAAGRYTNGLAEKESVHLRAGREHEPEA